MKMHHPRPGTMAEYSLRKRAGAGSQLGVVVGSAKGFLAITAHTANNPAPAFAGNGIGNQKSEARTICGNIVSHSGLAAGCLASLANARFATSLAFAAPALELNATHCFLTTCRMAFLPAAELWLDLPKGRLDQDRGLSSRPFYSHSP